MATGIVVVVAICLLVVGLRVLAGRPSDDNRAVGSSGATSRAATLRVVDVEPRVTVREWLRRVAISQTDYERRKAAFFSEQFGAGQDPASEKGLLHLSGLLVTLRTTFEGFRDQSTVLRWTLFHSATRRVVREPGFSDVPVARPELQESIEIEMQEIRLPPPPTRGDFFVRLALYDPGSGGRRNTLLARDDSAPFHQS